MGKSPSKNLKDAPVVVIVGAGPAGVTVAKGLDSVANVVLIDRKDYYLNNIAALRAAVRPGYSKQILIPYDKAMKNGHFVQTEVTKITSTEVFVANRDKPIEFDYLVICTGSAYAFPAKVALTKYDDVVPMYGKLNALIKEAKNIVVVGGGPVGIELVGEITDIYSEGDRTVNLVHSKAKLINDDFSDKFRDTVTERVAGRPCVKLHLGQRLVLDEEMKANQNKMFLKRGKAVKTDKGTEIPCDLLFWATGAQGNTRSFAGAFPQEEKTNKLIVNKMGLVEGQKNVYAAGDCCNWGDDMAYYAFDQGAAIVKNIKATIAGKDPSATWEQKGFTMIVPIGEREGACQFGKHVMGRKVARAIKGKDLFCGAYWKLLGQSKKDRGVAEVEEKTDAEIADNTKSLAEAMNLSEDEAAKLAKGFAEEEKDISFT